jgi:hypothetical protein
MALLLWTALGILWLTQIVVLARPIPAAIPSRERKAGDEGRTAAHDGNGRPAPMRLIAGRKTAMRDLIVTPHDRIRIADRRHGARRPAA